MSRLTLTGPDDYDLARDVCSYGYFRLAPNDWDPGRETLTRPLHLVDGPATFTIAQPDGAGAPLKVRSDRRLSRSESADARRQIERMLRLHEDLADFHAVDPRWRDSGRGRIFRSPTLFEDVIKTITSCNVTWKGTINMNRRLCEVIDPAFPRPAQLARRRPATLRARCGVGYRDVRLVELARLFRDPALTVRLEDASRTDDDVHRELLGLPGVGPYAAANILQLLGRFSRLAIDTEMIAHGREALGMTGTPRQIEKQLHAHYERFGDQKFRSYWIERWTHYESDEGPASGWA